MKILINPIMFLKIIQFYGYLQRTETVKLQVIKLY